MEIPDVELCYLFKKLKKIHKEGKGGSEQEQIERNLAFAISQRIKSHPAIKAALRHDSDIAPFIYPEDTSQHPMVA